MPAPLAERGAAHISRERRRRRRKSRHRGEEILGWILVPVILFGLFWGVNAVLEPRRDDATCGGDGVSRGTSAASAAPEPAVARQA
jgi:hypothetical protein